jgi:hypothetical protein
MDKQETIQKLNMLMHLDRETARLYAEAIPTVGESDVAVTLEGYRRDHARHADECFFALKDLGSDPLPTFPEFDDFIRMHEDAVVNAGHLDTSLMSLFMLEEAVNFEYAESAMDNYPGGVKQVIQTHLSDDRQHLQEIKTDLIAASDAGTSVRIGV